MNALELQTTLQRGVKDALSSNPNPGFLTDTLNQLIKFTSKRDVRELCLSHALTLMENKMYNIAQTVFLRVDIFENCEDSRSIFTRVVLYTQLCKFYMLLQEDQYLKSATTVSACFPHLFAACEALKHSFPEDEALYYVIHDGTVLLYNAAQCLIKASYFREAITVISWCAQCCDSTLSLCTIKFLPWRYRLYATWAQCCEMRKDIAGARKVATAFLKKAFELRTLEVSDFVLPAEPLCKTMQGLCDAGIALVGRYESLEDLEAGKISSAASLVEKIRSVISNYTQGEHSEAVAKLQAFALTSAHLVSQTLLTMLWEPNVRVISHSSSKIPRRNDSATEMGVEAFLSLVHPLLVKYVNPAADVSDLATAKKKDAAPAKGGKKDAKAAEDLSLGEQISLTDILSCEQHFEVCQLLFMNGDYDNFQLWQDGLALRLEKEACALKATYVKIISILKTVQPLLGTASAHQKDATNNLLTTLDSALSDEEILTTRPDIIEDMSLLLHAVWMKEVHPAESPLTVQVFSTIVRGLIAIKSEDVLLITNLALVAAECMEQALQYDESLSLCKSVDVYLQQWRVQYSRNSAYRSTSILASTVLDMRTILNQVLVRTALKLGVEVRFAGLQDEHQRKLAILKDRKDKEGIFGTMSKKEQSVFEHTQQAVIERPVNAEDAERRLKVKYSGNDLMLAVIAIECVRFRSGPNGAYSCLQTAQQHILTAQNIPKDEQSLSLNVVWATFVTKCAEIKAYDLSQPGTKYLLTNFVVIGKDLPVWEQNPCSRDSIDAAGIKRSSNHLVRLLSYAFMSIGMLEESQTANVTKYSESDEQGLDPRRSEAQPLQMSRLRTINWYLMANQLAYVVQDDSLTIQIASAVLNAVQPFITQKTQSSLVFRPLLVVALGLANIPSRRWADENLQLSAARTLFYAIEGVKTMSVEFQKNLYKLLYEALADMYVKTLQNPNEGQQRHLHNATKQLQKQAIIHAPIAGVAATGLSGKAGGKPPAGKDKVEGGPSASDTGGNSDAGSLTLEDVIPAEWVDLIDRIFFTHSAATYLTKEQLPQVPAAYWALSTALSKGTGIKECLEENRNSWLYLKLVCHASRRLMQIQKGDQSKELVNIALNRVKDKMESICTKEMETMTAVIQTHLKEAEAIKKEEKPKPPPKGQPTPGEEPAPVQVNPVDKATKSISHWVSTARRKIAFRQIRIKIMQTDVPNQAQLHLLHAMTVFQEWCVENDKLVETQLRASSNMSNATVDKPDPKKAPPKPAAAAKKPEDGKPAPPTITIAETNWTKPTAIVGSLTRSLVCFARIGKWKHVYNVLLFLINVCRTMYGNNLPCVINPVQLNDGTESAATSRKVSRSNTPRVGLSPDARVEEGLKQIEQYMKQTCFHIVALLEALDSGKCDLSQDDSSLLSTCIETGYDVMYPGGLLAHTTSIAQRTTARGKTAQERRLQEEEKMASRIAKMHAMDRLEIEDAERKQRYIVEKEQYETLTDELQKLQSKIKLFSDETMKQRVAPQRVKGQASASKSNMGTLKMGAEKAEEPKLRATTKAPAAAAAAEDKFEEVPFLNRMGDVSLDEIFRCMMYVLQSLQYGQKKDSLVSCGERFNTLTKDRYNVLLTPFLMSILNSVGKSYESLKQSYEKAMRNQPRTLKLMSRARRYYQASAQQPVISPTTTKIKYAAYGEIVSVYNNAIAYLRQKHSVYYLVTFLHELGSVHYGNNNISEARQSWSDAIDVVFGVVHVVHNWRSVVYEKLSKQVIARLGLWKILMSCLVLSKLARYADIEDRTRVTEEILFASYLIKCLSTSTLLFPQREWDFAGAKLSELFPDVRIENGFGNTSNGILVEICQSLHFIAHHLTQHGFHLLAIPVTVFMEHIASAFLRNVNYVVQARLIRAQASAESANFETAISTLMSVFKGSQLPDRSLSHNGLYVDLDTTKTTAPLAAAAKPADKKPADKKAPQAAATTEQSDDTSVSQTLFRNDLPLSHEINRKIIDMFTSVLVGNALPTNVRNFYSPTLATQTLQVTATVLIALAMSEAPQCLEMAPPDTGAPPEKPGKGEKGGKGQKDDTDASNASSNVCTQLLIKANDIYQMLLDENMKKSPMTEQDSFNVLNAQLGIGKILGCKGLWQKALSYLTDALGAYRTRSHGVLLPVPLGIPTFVCTVDATTVLNVLTISARAAWNLKRYDTMNAIVTSALELSASVNDKFQRRYFLILRAMSQLIEGDMSGLDSFQEVVQLHQQLNFDAYEGNLALCLLHFAQVKFDMTIRPDLCTIETMKDVFAAPKDTFDSPTQWLKTAFMILRDRCKLHDLNTSLTPQWSTLYEKHNPSIIEYACSIAQYSSWLIRKGECGKATEILQDGLLAIQQGRDDLYPHNGTRLRLLLAQVQRMSATTNTIDVDSWGTWKSATANTPITEGEIVLTSPSLREGGPCALLLNNIKLCVLGTHDHETLRGTLNELTLWFGSMAKNGPAYGVVAARCMLLATQTYEMMKSLYGDTSTLKVTTLTNVEELPACVVSDLNELRQRETYSQSAFDFAFKDSVPIEAGKGGGGGKVDPKSPLPPPAASTLISSTVFNYFTLLSKEMNLCVPYELGLQETKLIKVRQYIQKYCMDSDHPILFGETPDVFVFPEIRQNMVCVQNYILKHALAPRTRSPDDVDSLVPPNYELQPRILMMFMIVPSLEGDVDASSQQVAGTKTEKALGKGGAKGQATTEVASKKIYPFLCALNVEQYLFHEVHAKVLQLKNVLISQQVRKEELDSLQAEQNANGLRPSTSSTKRPDTSESVVGDHDMKPKDIDLLKGTILNGILNMIRRARHGVEITDQAMGEAAKEALLPRFGLVYRHVDILANLFDGSGGGMAEDSDLAQWLHTLLSHA